LGEPTGREGYRWALDIPTRWMDTDAHGHVNNVQYYSFFDTVVTAWLIDDAGFDVRSEPVIGLCVESACEFKAPLEFPQRVEGRLRVGRVGRSSVRYEIGLFADGVAEAAATGHFVHVYVGREDRRPTQIPAALRSALTRLEG
jgi:acyl-CoA thioester hydrolase